MNIFEWNLPGDRIYDAEGGKGRLLFPLPLPSLFGWFAIFGYRIKVTSFFGFINVSRSEGR